MEVKTLLITQARIGSTRLPGKVLKEVEGISLLEIHLQRLAKCKSISQILVATTENPADEIIANKVEELGLPVFRGSEQDVLDRFYQAALPYKPEWVVRVTSDCPLLDHLLVDEIVESAISRDIDYCSNTLSAMYPDGQDVEIFRFSSLERAWEEAILPSEREHVTPFIRNNSSFYGGAMFKSADFPCQGDFSGLRMTVDEINDFSLISRLVADLGTNKAWEEYTQHILENELYRLNEKNARNEGYYKSLEKDKVERYKKSEELLERALKTVPLGSQTFSKSKTQLPFGVSPYFATRAEGAYLFDADGNKYIDFVNSLASVTLGYNDPDVTAAVKDQLGQGVIFSLANELEFVVAEKIVEMVPCAEMVRFGKNGSDATAGAVRLARAYTNRDHILVCGYHGWQDWYIGSTARSLGVPEATKSLTHSFQYNNISSLEQLFEQYADKVAAVILEPINLFAPKDNFLEKVKDVTHKNGAVLIFDETITGFRYSNGGAQELFGVTPDLACFGKGLANGYPVSAVAGKAEIMRVMEDIFFSFTFGGELLSLAAANATLEKLQREPVVAHLKKVGTELIVGLKRLIENHNFSHVFAVEGYPVWSFFTIKDTEDFSSWEIKTLLLQEMFKKGIYTIGTHNMSYAHTSNHVNELLKAYDAFFLLFVKATAERNILRYIKGKVLEPLFKVR
jgi:glutamate-1-semialdehyde 2,1-aminomutase